MARFWTSDLHFGHQKVIEYCKRPFTSVSDMDEGLIANWNKVVGKEDTVVFLGDWSMHHRYYAYLARLNFAKLEYVAGNHCRVPQLLKMLEADPALQALASKIVIHTKSTVIEVGGKEFFCSHRPLDARDDMPMLCGHVHEKWKFLPPGTEITEHSRNYTKESRRLAQPILNVGCDQHDYHPIDDAGVLEFFK